MTSTIKVDNIQNQCGANIINESSDTITIGASGDTIALASGASQTGFGRTGTVDWQTSIKTGDFTAVSGEGYFINTTSGAITMTLPASPSAGDIVAVKDYANTFDTNLLTINRNSQPIGGAAENAFLSTEGIAVTLVYADATKGWLTTDSALQSEAPGALFVVATGGTITTCGNFKSHVFTGPGTFTVSCQGNPAGSNSVDYFVVAGGGGGGGRSSSGGGGAGGFRLSNTTCMPSPQTSPLVAPNSPSPAAIPVAGGGAFPVTVGGGGSGGAGPANPSIGASGTNSIFSTITSAGGGGGNCWPNPGPSAGGAGGSGGGGGAAPGPSGPFGVGGAGNTPPTTPAQGFNGGTGGGAGCGGGGGGGASAVGQAGGAPNSNVGGDGGAGSFVVQAGFAGCNGTPGPVSGARYFSGGAGGRSGEGNRSGGVGGGGTGASNNSGMTAGGTNTGGGGGGSGGSGTGANGGSGIVVIRYKFQ